MVKVVVVMVKTVVVTVMVVCCYKTVHESLDITETVNKHPDLICNTVLLHDHNLWNMHSDKLSVHLLLYDRLVIHIF